MLDDIYPIYPDYLIGKMNEEEKKVIVYEFKTSLYADMEIALEKVFMGMF